MLGMFFYYFMGLWLYNGLFLPGKYFVLQYITSQDWGIFFSYLLTVIFAIFLFFIINWTFMLFVTAVSSPFNDYISAQVEKIYFKKEETKNKFVSYYAWVFVNEFKKIFIVIGITTSAWALSFFPVLFPISLTISSLLIAYSFLDYSWCRHDYGYRNCFKTIKKYFFGYLSSGFIFLVLLSIPIINLVAISWATVHFTILFIKKEKFAEINTNE